MAEPPQKPGSRPRIGAGLAPARPGGRKPPTPQPPPKWREYANNPAVVAALFAIAVLAFVTQVPGMFRGRPPYETHPCCGMKFYSCECGCQGGPARCTCRGRVIFHEPVGVQIIVPDVTSAPRHPR